MGRGLRQAFATQARIAREQFLAQLQAEGAHTAQASMLERAVIANASTEFGKEHGFDSVATFDDFRSRVPIRHYEELAPWIDRAAAGEPRVLTTEDPIRFWKTTGTTSTSKKIPVTPSAAAAVTQSFMALQGTQLHYYPELNERPDTMLYAHISPKAVKEYLGGGRIPYCSTTEAPVEIRRGMEDFVAPWMKPLQSVEEDDTKRLYFLLCYAAAHELRAIGCLHPSRFHTVVNVLSKEWPRLVREVYEGTVLGTKMRAPMPERARELERVAEAAGALRPRDIWPNLRFLTSWSGSYIQRYMPLMESAYGSDFIPMPSISSECFMTQTIDKDRVGQPLNVRGALHEFVPSGETVRGDTKTLLFDELVQDGTYEIVLTTLGGLYRYAMCDIFRVVGFVGSVPRLEYIGRRSVSDLTGEKLAEEQVSACVRASLAEARLTAVLYTVCAVHDDRPDRRPRYVLAIEAPEPIAPEAAEALAARVDGHFRRVNSRYELKRSFGDLDPVEALTLPLGTFAAYRNLLIGRGMPAGQIKDRVLHPVGAPVVADLRSLR
jgi:hypothetical protein